MITVNAHFNTRHTIEHNDHEEEKGCAAFTSAIIRGDGGHVCIFLPYRSRLTITIPEKTEE